MSDKRHTKQVCYSIVTYQHAVAFRDYQFMNQGSDGPNSCVSGRGINIEPSRSGCFLKVTSVRN